MKLNVEVCSMLALVFLNGKVSLYVLCRCLDYAIHAFSIHRSTVCIVYAAFDRENLFPIFSIPFFPLIFPFIGSPKKKIPPYRTACTTHSLFNKLYLLVALSVFPN